MAEEEEVVIPSQDLRYQAAHLAGALGGGGLRSRGGSFGSVRE